VSVKVFRVEREAVLDKLKKWAQGLSRDKNVIAVVLFGSFAKGERGQISKQSMLTVGSIVGGAAIGAAISLKAVKGGRTYPRLGRSHINAVKKDGGMNPMEDKDLTKYTYDVAEGNITVTHTTSGQVKITHSSY